MSLKKIKAIRGMHDITPDKSGHWAQIEKTVAAVFAAYAYREIRMPIVENTGLFRRSIGEVTDIVENAAVLTAAKLEGYGVSWLV